jgi:hypothetical protein
MKNLLVISVAAAAAALALADENRSKEPPATLIEKTTEIVRERKEPVSDTTKRVGTLTREMWFKSHAYQSEDPTIYRVGAEQKLTELAQEIAAVKTDAGVEPPAYFRTRVLALEQQHAYLTAQLPKLTPEEIKARMSGNRLAFDQCIEALEEAIDQAAHEARKLVKVALK